MNEVSPITGQRGIRRTQGYGNATPTYQPIVTRAQRPDTCPSCGARVPEGVPHVEPDTRPWRYRDERRSS